MDAARPPTEPTEEQVQEVHRRGLRSHRWAVTALVVVSLVVAAAGTARLLPLLPDDAAGTRPAGEITVVPSPSAVSATVDARSPHSAQPAPEPRVFLGGIGGGSERTAVISVATGTVLRYLIPPPGSPALGVLSPDRRIWFEPAGEGPCGSSWRAITVSSGVITPAQVLMVVVPADSGIEVEAMVLNKDIGFVHDGDPAEIKIDTFNFTKYGLLHGKVLGVSQDAILRDKPAGQSTSDRQAGQTARTSEPPGQELLYAVHVSLDKTKMQIDDRRVDLSPGMAVTVEIKTGQRRIIEFLLSPLLRYKQESLRER